MEISPKSKNLKEFLGNKRKMKEKAFETSENEPLHFCSFPAVFDRNPGPFVANPVRTWFLTVSFKVRSRIYARKTIIPRKLVQFVSETPFAQGNQLTREFKKSALKIYSIFAPTFRTGKWLISTLERDIFWNKSYGAGGGGVKTL